MAHREKRWSSPPVDLGLEAQLIEELSCSGIIARLLINRGIKTVDEAKRFLNPSHFDLHNPFLLKDMTKVIDRIREALKRKEKILIFGDRDVDGISSVALMVRTLSSLGGIVQYYIPTSEGYGLNIPALQRAIDDNIGLVITVDCGITNVEEVKFAKERGLDLIITDHHQVQDEIPDALAVINPKQKDCPYPFKELAGCTVAFKVLEALLYSQEPIFHYNQNIVVLDLETTGLDSQEDEIIEIGAVKIRNDIVLEEFEMLIKPKNKIPLGATAINGITNEMVAKSPSIKKVLPEFLRFIDNAILVAHNADFDLRFLRNKAEDILDKEITNSVIDTLAQSRNIFPLTPHSLSTICRKLEVKTSPNHRALDDARAAKEVYLKLRDLIQPRIQHFIHDNLDLLTLGTIGDIVPLRDENRIIVKHGLGCLYETNKTGLKVLLEECGDIRNFATARTVSWRIIPILNAAGRMRQANLGADLLITKDEETAEKLVDEIISLNNKRKNLQTQNLKQILPLVPQQVDLDKDKVIVVSTDKTEHGVTGIVASQIMRQFNRPVVILIITEDEAMGAARSIENFDITEALNQCSDLLTKFGGHKKAAGLTLPADRIDEFRQKLNQVADELMTQEDIIPSLNVEGELDMSEISAELIKELEQLEPYGSSNPSPVFIMRSVQVTSHNKMGRDNNHLRMNLYKDDNFIGAVGWKMGSLVEDILSTANRIDLAFQVEINNWQGKEYVRLVLQDMKHCQI